MTPQEKEQYFAQYWGQNVARYKGDPKIVIVDSGLMNCLECFENVKDNAYLELAAVKNITDEDARGVAEIYGLACVSKITRIDNAILLQDGLYELRITFDGFIFARHNGEIYNIITLQAHQYLQGKGYAQSFRNYSVESLILEKVLKLK